eukprot:7390374-Prymnesium_polylepis.1
MPFLGHRLSRRHVALMWLGSCSLIFYTSALGLGFLSSGTNGFKAPVSSRLMPALASSCGSPTATEKVSFSTSSVIGNGLMERSFVP